MASGQPRLPQQHTMDHHTESAVAGGRSSKAGNTICCSCDRSMHACSTIYIARNGHSVCGECSCSHPDARGAPLRAPPRISPGLPTIGSRAAMNYALDHSSSWKVVAALIAEVSRVGGCSGLIVDLGEAVFHEKDMLEHSRQDLMASRHRID